jgi:hypothetical protein
MGIQILWYEGGVYAQYIVCEAGKSLSKVKEESMSRRILGILGIGVILILGVSCQRLGEPVRGGLTLGVQALTQAGSIPASWGKLISTSSCPAAKEWIQLWFQDDAGTVRMVAYNLEKNTLFGEAILFRRD